MDVETLFSRHYRADATAALYSACPSLPPIKGIKGTHGAPTHIVSHPSVKAGSPNQEGPPVWRRNSHNTQRSPVMGGAAFHRKDGQEYKRPAMDAKALASRGRGVASTAPNLHGEEVLMLSVRAKNRGATPVGDVEVESRIRGNVYVRFGEGLTG